MEVLLFHRKIPRNPFVCVEIPYAFFKGFTIFNQIDFLITNIKLVNKMIFFPKAGRLGEKGKVTRIRCYNIFEYSIAVFNVFAVELKNFY